jgi:hypothetical protein
MLRISWKKNAALALAVIGLSGVAKAGTIYSDPGITNSYSNLDGSPTGSLASGGTLTMTGNGSPSTPAYSDFTNSGTSFSFTPGTLDVITFTMNTSITGTNGSSHNPAVGVNVIGNNGAGDILASMFSVYGPDGNPDLLVSNGADGTQNVPGQGTAPSGSAGTYTLTLDPGKGVFFASYGGQTYEGSLAYTGETPVEVSLSGIDQGIAGSAQFSNFSITTAVPEPASMGMIGLGGLLLLAKRPKKQVV